MSKPSLIAGTLMLLVGAGICGYLAWTIPPYHADGTDNIQMILVMFAGIFLATGGIGTLLVRKMHQRWPVLKGRTHEDVSLRQGMLAGLGICIAAVLALFDLLDFAMAVSVAFLIILLETFLQNRRSAS